MEKFASILFPMLGIPSFSVRYSDNYFGGKYVVSRSLGLEVQLSLDDSSGLPEYSFRLSLIPTVLMWKGADYSALDGLTDLLARKLAFDGFEVARPLGPRA